jgi:hypothetical protein
MPDQYILDGMKTLAKRAHSDRAWSYFGIKLPDSNDSRLGLHYPREREVYAVMLPIREGIIAVKSKSDAPILKIKMSALREFLHREEDADGQIRRNKGALYQKKLMKYVDEYVAQISREKYFVILDSIERQKAMRNQDKLF